MIKDTYQYMNYGCNTIIMLIHGLGCSSVYYSDIIRHLNNSFNILSIDLIGHGKNRGMKLDTINDQVEQIDEILTFENISADYVIAHSVSSLVAFELDNLLDFRNIILLDGNLIINDFKWTSEISEMKLSEFETYWNRYVSRYKIFLKLNTSQKIDNYHIYGEDIKMVNKDMVYRWAKLAVTKKITSAFYSKSFYKTILLESYEKDYYDEKEKFCQKHKIKMIPVKNAKHFLLIEKPYEIANEIQTILNNN